MPDVMVHSSVAPDGTETVVLCFIDHAHRVTDRRVMTAWEARDLAKSLLASAAGCDATFYRIVEEQEFFRICEAALRASEREREGVD